jgi:hypothetical protein
MRRYRAFAVVVVSVVLSVGMFARPHERREPRGPNRLVKIVKVMKKVIKSLGDGISVPTP